jgi:Fe-S oxidoreductase
MGRILERAGLRFSVLGGDEWCCGYPLHNAGYVDDVGGIAEHHVALLAQANVSTLVTPCPSCYYAWRFLYPRYVQLPSGLRILHSTQLLAELMAAGRLAARKSEIRATYHDPCDLGRKSGEYDAARALLLQLVGVELHEMANTRAEGLCCGGGGDVKIYSQDTTMDVAKRRLRQAIDVGADTVVSACLQCKRALTGAVQLARLPTRVLDITELIWEQMQEPR